MERGINLSPRSSDLNPELLSAVALPVWGQEHRLWSGQMEWVFSSASFSKALSVPLV